MNVLNEKIDAGFILAHPMATAAAGLATVTGASIANNLITVLPLIHQIISIVAMGIGAAASSLGLYVQLRKEWKSRRAEKLRQRRKEDLKT